MGEATRRAHEQLLRSIVTEHCAGPVIKIVPMVYGHRSVTSKVFLTQQTVFVRTNENPDVFRGTAKNLNILTEQGFPVPQVLAQDLSKTTYPFAYIITDAFEGHDLGYELTAMPQSTQQEIASQIVGLQRRAAGLPMAGGYGFAPIGERAPHSCWYDAVLADRASLKEPISSGVEGFSQRQREVCVALENSRPQLSAIAPTPFFDDLTTKNVILHDGRLQGIVDFDVICYGDPMYWLSLTNVALAADVGDNGQFYLAALMEAWNPADREMNNYGLYSAIHALEFLSRLATDEARRQRLAAVLDHGLAVNNAQRHVVAQRHCHD